MCADSSGGGGAAFVSFSNGLKGANQSFLYAQAGLVSKPQVCRLISSRVNQRLSAKHISEFPKHNGVLRKRIGSKVKNTCSAWAKVCKDTFLNFQHYIQPAEKGTKVRGTAGHT